MEKEMREIGRNNNQRSHAPVTSIITPTGTPTIRSLCTTPHAEPTHTHTHLPTAPVSGTEVSMRNICASLHRGHDLFRPSVGASDTGFGDTSANDQHQHQQHTRGHHNHP
eukprot:TRINITY_DN49113_c0_g1_i1.p2 TRINITY_DN49113_c0_g1~~TRINITY_DN49113_c0_g1_i1.p2  ORF type:complete len:110 (+),score=2.30 TRINITY_DN49113_c0_g1_i1:137-466(+)